MLPLLIPHPLAVASVINYRYPSNVLFLYLSFLQLRNTGKLCLTFYLREDLQEAVEAVNIEN
jgi:hypothetical protein